MLPEIPRRAGGAEVVDDEHGEDHQAAEDVEAEKAFG
jgi:hypothetical protein